MPEPFKIKMPSPLQVEKPALSSPARRKRILRNVALAHAAVILLPLGILSVMAWIHPKPKPETIKITLTSPVQRRHGDPKLRPAPQNAKQNAPKLRPPTPTEPSLTRAPSEPKLAPTKAPKQPPRPAKTKPTHKYDPSRLAKNIKTKPKPEPKRENSLDDLTVVDSLPTLPDTGRRTQTTSAANDAPGTGDSNYATYDEELIATLYDLWTPPSDALLNGRKPEVLVRIRVNASGRVLKAEILKRSGFDPMDDSVRKLLRSLSQLPDPPKDHLEFEIVFIPLDK